MRNSAPYQADDLWESYQVTFHFILTGYTKNILWTFTIDKNEWERHSIAIVKYQFDFFVVFPIHLNLLTWLIVACGW